MPHPKIIKREYSRAKCSEMPLQLRAVRMKNSLYLLIPKGIAELLELDENRECNLTTEAEGSGPVLRYSFTSATTRSGDGPAVRKRPVREARVNA